LKDHRANIDVDWQQRATEFTVGDRVTPYGQWADYAGRVVAVFPAIGMADVEYPHGTKRYPVEDLQRIDSDGNANPPSTDDTVPGGRQVQVPGGPYPSQKVASESASTERVARAFVKQSLYWGAKDRRYRATRPESNAGQFHCPKCKRQGIESVLQPAIYKRRDGKSDRLLGCQGCLFLIKQLDIENLSVGAPAEVEIEMEGAD
jgi:hypothetical protein